MKPSGIYFYQIVVIIISIIMLYQGFNRFLKKESGQTVFKLLIRMIIWGGMLLVVIFPRITNRIAEFIGMEGNINAVVLSGFVLVFLMLFKLMSAIEKLEQKLTELTRKDSIKEIENK